MISIVYCTREHNQKHLDHLKKMAGHPKVEVIEYINNGVSLTKAYNELMNKTKFDVVVFCHDDIEIQTKQFAKKLLKHYDDTDYGILGVAGTKTLPENGRWWSDVKQMYGRVWHTHQGKKYLSKYSDDLGKDIEEVVIVDGVFFSVKKSRMKVAFDESVEGFHFYDLTFCLQNYLKGVKIGVHTDISINHMSIGETNEQWEENRVIFAEKYKSNLPVKIDSVFKDGHKFKVLIGCLNFNSYTGSELYNFELAKGLVERGCDVTVCSNIGGELSIQAKRLGIKLSNINEPNGFKRGDGKWQIQGGDGKLHPSTAGTLYKISATNYDIMHLSHTPVVKLLTQIYPDVPTISSIHSEIISLEHPVIHENIKKYIAIRPEIKEYIIKEHNIPEEKIEVIYNPIDDKRFNTESHEKYVTNRVLFVGTIDYLRKNVIIDLIKATKESNKTLVIVGKENGVNIQELIEGHDHVSYHLPTKFIEDYIADCDETAGILLGRTTIEGWMCGKGGWIYDVDDEGNILSKAFHEVPEDVAKFNTESVVSEIIEQYKEILK